MATRPTKLPRWATVPTVDPISNSNNIYEPSEAKKDVGWGLEYPPSNIQNWLMNLVYQWVEYLDEVREQLPVFTAELVLPAGTPEVYEVDLGGRFDAVDDDLFIRIRFDSSNTKLVVIKFIDIAGTPEESLVSGRDFKILGNGEIQPEVEYLISFNSDRHELLIINASTLNEILLQGFAGLTNGTANALILNSARGIDPTTGLSTGIMISVIPHVTVAAGATLNYSGTGSKPIKVLSEAFGYINIEANTWIIDTFGTLQYNGAGYWVLLTAAKPASVPDASARLSKVKPMTPFTLDTQQATQAVKGLVFLSAASDVNTPPSTNITKAMSPGITELFYDARRASLAQAQAALDNYYHMTSLRTDDFYQARKASGAEVRTGTDTNKFTPISNLKDHRGMAKAYASFDNTTPTAVLLGAYNVSSVTVNGIVEYTITLSPAMPNTNYTVVATSQFADAGGWLLFPTYEIISASTFRLKFSKWNDGVSVEVRRGGFGVYSPDA